jgi:hypothetical protein
MKGNRVGFTLTILATWLCVPALRAEKFNWVYVNGYYSCHVGNGIARRSYRVVTISQVFGICLSEIDSVNLAQSQQRNSDQVAEGKCRGGELSQPSFLEGYMSESQSTTEQKRDEFIRHIIASDNTTLTDTFYLSVPYSRACR